MTAFEILIQSVKQKSARVCVIGLGYVGLPILNLAKSAGYKIRGFDIDTGKITALRAGNCVNNILPDFAMANLLSGGEEVFFDDSPSLAGCDIYWICVPTPEWIGRPDLAALVKAFDDLALNAKGPFLVVISSTSFPGSCCQLGLKILEAAGLKSGEDFLLVVSPEREDPGNKIWQCGNIPRVYAGLDEHSETVGGCFLESLFSSVVKASSLQVAELCKLLENSFRNVNIAFINEFSRFTGVLGLDVFEIINLAATKPFGFMPFWPGTGVGGHCIPVDPYYLLEVARVNGVQLKALNESCFINANQVDWFVGRVHQLFLDMGLKPGFSTVLIAGLAYKKNVADVRNSPALSVASKLQSAGWLVKCYDPIVAEYAKNTDLTQFDVALKMVDHDCIQDDFLKTKARRVLSWQNILS